MPKRVVNVLEFVEIDEQDRESVAAALCVDNSVTYAVKQSNSIRQTGQHIELCRPRYVSNLFFVEGSLRVRLHYRPHQIFISFDKLC